MYVTPPAAINRIIKSLSKLETTYRETSGNAKISADPAYDMRKEGDVKVWKNDDIGDFTLLVKGKLHTYDWLFVQMRKRELPGMIMPLNDDMRRSYDILVRPEDAGTFAKVTTAMIKELREAHAQRIAREAKEAEATAKRLTKEWKKATAPDAVCALAGFNSPPEARTAEQTRSEVRFAWHMVNPYKDVKDHETNDKIKKINEVILGLVESKTIRRADFITTKTDAGERFIEARGLQKLVAGYNLAA